MLDAQGTADKVVTATALQKVLDACDYNAMNEVHLPALLRSVQSFFGNVDALELILHDSCAARLWLSESENGEAQDNDVADKLCSIFERGEPAFKPLDCG